MENADSIKIEKFKSIKGFRLSNEQYSKEEKRIKSPTITIVYCHFILVSSNGLGYNVKSERLFCLINSNLKLNNKKTIQ